MSYQVLHKGPRASLVSSSPCTHGFNVAPETVQTGSFPWAFPLDVPCTWNTSQIFASRLTFLSSGLCSHVIFSSTPFLTTQFKIVVLSPTFFFSQAFSLIVLITNPHFIHIYPLICFQLLSTRIKCKLHWRPFLFQSVLFTPPFQDLQNSFQYKCQQMFIFKINRLNNNEISLPIYQHG